MSRTRSSFLQRSPAFGRVDETVLRRILVRSTSAELERRQVLWRQGEPVTAIGWVRSGVLRESMALEDRELVLGFHGRGDLIGEVGALESLVHGDVLHPVTLDAHEETVVQVLPIRELSELMDRDPALARAVAAVCAERRRRVEEKLAGLVFRTARARMAASLIDLSATFGVRDSRGVIVNLRLTHRDLAGLAGASRETASTALLEWRRDGLVLVEGKRVVLLDPERLADVARDAM